MSDIKDPSQKQRMDKKQAPARRSFLRKAAIGAPLLTTITSTSVFAVGRASISGNLSGNTSHTHEVSLWDGCSPGYYHTNDVNDTSSIRGTILTYDKPFNQVLTNSYGFNCPDKLAVVLSPKFWHSGHPHYYPHTNASSIHRVAITAYLNALTKPNGFPYKATDIVNFYASIDGFNITESDAITIFNNLIHKGMGDLDSDDC